MSFSQMNHKNTLKINKQYKNNLNNNNNNYNNNNHNNNNNNNNNKIYNSLCKDNKVNKVKQ